MGVLPVCVCLCTTCVPGDCGGQKKVLGFLELELKMAVNCHVGAGNQTQGPQEE